MIEPTGPPEPAPAPPRRAIRWLRNGDHPDDGVGEQDTDPLTGDSYTRLEGRVVRWYMRPDRPGSERHEGRDGCWKPWSEHGWIDEGADGITVCPGMLVVDKPDGGHEVLKLEPVYRDRNNGYVPAGLNLSLPEQRVEVSEGTKGRSAAQLEVYMAAAAGVIRGLLDLRESEQVTAEWIERNVHAAHQWLETCAKPARYETYSAPKTARLALAMPDEFNRDQREWWWADVSGDGTHWSQFRGHRVQVDVEFRTANYRDVNDWKGRDEIRPGGEWRILLNRQPVDGGDIGSDPVRTLDDVRRKVQWLLEQHTPLDLTDSRPYRQQLIGRRVYYHQTPAVVTDTVLDQGCVILKPVGVPNFPRQAYELDSEPDGTGHDEQDLYDPGEERTVKVELDSPAIWWWRRRPYGPDETDERYRPRRGRAVEVQAEPDKEDEEDHDGRD